MLSEIRKEEQGKKAFIPSVEAFNKLKKRVLRLEKKVLELEKKRKNEQKK